MEPIYHQSMEFSVLDNTSEEWKVVSGAAGEIEFMQWVLDDNKR